MREITKTVYKFDELSDEAKDRAVEIIREKVAGPWWDGSDVEDIAAEIVMEFATALGTPGSDEYGAYDFPGIPDVTLEAWDVDRLEASFKGTLTRETAPKLPWDDGIEDVRLRAGRSNTIVYPMNLDDLLASRAGHEKMIDAVLFAVSRAIRAGHDAYEYKTGDEANREWCENNTEQEYNADGTLAD